MMPLLGVYSDMDVFYTVSLQVCLELKAAVNTILNVIILFKVANEVACCSSRNRAGAKFHTFFMVVANPEMVISFLTPTGSL